jgi:hypothetical protein
MKNVDEAKKSIVVEDGVDKVALKEYVSGERAEKYSY